MPFGWAAAGAAALSAGGAVANGIIGSKAAGSAASTEANAYNQASGVEQSMFDQTQQNLQPFISGGTNALTSLQKLLNIGPGTTGNATNPILQMLGIGGPGGTGAGNINPATFQGSPGFQYQIQQGTNAVTNSAAANGGLGGNALRALQQTGQGLANQNFSQYLGQTNSAYNSLIGQLQNISGEGAATAGQLGSIATNVGAQIGGNDIGTGSALASGTLGSANAMAGGISGVTKALASLLMSGGGGMGGAGFSSNGVGSSLSANDYLTSLGMSANPSQAMGLNSGMGGFY